MTLARSFARFSQLKNHAEQGICCAPLANNKRLCSLSAVTKLDVDGYCYCGRHANHFSTETLSEILRLEKD